MKVAATAVSAEEAAQELGPWDSASSRMVGSAIVDSTSGSTSVVSSRMFGSAVMDSASGGSRVSSRMVGSAVMDSASGGSASSRMGGSVSVDRSASVVIELMESENIRNYIYL